MIIEKESEIKVLRNFYNSPFDYFSVAEISKRTNISRNWIYRVINKFEKSFILSKDGKKFKLDFSNLFCKRLKLLFDSEYLSCLEPKTRDKVFNISNKIIFEIKPKSIVLVGSAALYKLRKESDTDFFVVGDAKEMPHLESCNIIIMSERELKEKYLKGDDFVISALLFGKIIFDENVFIKIYENPLPIFSQELIQEKVKYCERLKDRVYTLLKMDEQQARKELLYLALQVARIILLRNNITPKTKHDIAGQVSQFDKRIAKIIQSLLKEKKASKEKILEHMRVCMEILK